jgi:hypothetical protein
MIHQLPITMVDNFGLGVDRWSEVQQWWDYTEREDQLLVNLGAGKKLIEKTQALDFPDWQAGMVMPFSEGSVHGFFAYHFFEHLHKVEIIGVLKEIERCLRPACFLNVVTPHWSSEAAHQDLDHKSFWSESTWRNLFDNLYYEGTMPRHWKLVEAATVIMGMTQRNLMIVSQIRRAYG